jgi:hypothetical protein
LLQGYHPKANAALAAGDIGLRVERFQLHPAWFELLPPRPEALQGVSVDAWLAPSPQVS